MGGGLRCLSVSAVQQNLIASEAAPDYVFRGLGYGRGRELSVLQGAAGSAKGVSAVNGNAKA